MRFSAEARRDTFAANVDTWPTSPPAVVVIGIDMARGSDAFERAIIHPRNDAADALLYGLAGSNLIDLSERFRPQPVSRPREDDTDFQAHVDRLLAEKPPQWLEYAFWGAITVMFFGGVIGICACLYS